VKDIPYIVFHAAYQYFESAYGLNAVGSITIDPERRPGAKRIKDIREKIKQLGARCVFSEPQFKSRLIATVIEGTEAKTGTLDPLGADLPAGPDAYFQLMTRLGANLLTGLK
jgi:zinc transport system substrate-binding protein